MFKSNGKTFNSFSCKCLLTTKFFLRLVDAQDPELTARKGRDGRNTFDWTFFNTFAEINEWLDGRVIAYPNVLSVTTYGTSLEGRPLRVFRYSERAVSAYSDQQMFE